MTQCTSMAGQELSSKVLLRHGSLAAVALLGPIKNYRPDICARKSLVDTQDKAQVGARGGIVIGNSRMGRRIRLLSIGPWYQQPVSTPELDWHSSISGYGTFFQSMPSIS